MSLFLGGTADALFARGPFIVITRLVDRFEDEVRRFKIDVEKAWERERAAEVLREQIERTRDAPPRVELLAPALRPRFSRLPRSGLPARFGFYQGSF